MSSRFESLPFDVVDLVLEEYELDLATGTNKAKAFAVLGEISSRLS